MWLISKLYQERGRRFNKEMRELDDKQCKMRQIGTAHLMEIMDDHDLLPTHNYKFGSHKDSPKIDSGSLEVVLYPGNP